MSDFTKTVRLGRRRPAWTARAFDVFARIEYQDGRLSISGVEGPLASGSCRGSCGQIDMTLREPGVAETWTDFAPGWDRDKVALFLIVWDRWHLNTMKAGSPEQEAFLRANPVTAVFPVSHYEVASAALATAGLNPDAEGYKYGSAWKREDVPAEVLAFLRALPDTDKGPAWV